MHFLHQGEISLPSIRGTLGFFFQLMVVMGILITSLFGLGLDWRLISAISIIFPAISLFSMMYVPESPYYLLKKGESIFCNPSICKIFTTIQGCHLILK